MLAIEYSRGIEDAWSDVASFVPKLFGFLVVLVVGWLVARTISRLADAALERLGFDRAVDRGGIRRVLRHSGYDASDVVGKVVYYALLLVVLQLAFGVFGDNPISDLLTGTIAYLPRVVAAMLIIVVAMAVAVAVKGMVEATLGGLDYGRTLAVAASAAIVTIGLFAALNQLRIAPEIVNGLFYALLAAMVGTVIVAVGGGGIRPMQSRWENVLARYDQEKPRVQMESRGASERIRQRAGGASEDHTQPMPRPPD